MKMCNVKNAEARKIVPPPFIVCIDPGHPSETAAGAEANGCRENRLELADRQSLGARSSNALHIPFVMTKTRLKTNA